MSRKELLEKVIADAGINELKELDAQLSMCQSSPDHTRRLAEKYKHTSDIEVWYFTPRYVGTLLALVVLPAISLLISKLTLVLWLFAVFILCIVYTIHTDFDPDHFLPISFNTRRGWEPYMPTTPDKINWDRLDRKLMKKFRKSVMKKVKRLPYGDRRELADKIISKKFEELMDADA